MLSPHQTSEVEFDPWRIWVPAIGALGIGFLAGMLTAIALL